MTRNLKFCLLFIFLNLLAISLKGAINLPTKNIDAMSSQSNIYIEQDTNVIKEPENETEQDFEKQSFIITANQFYYNLRNFNSLYIFEIFQNDYLFKVNLISSADTNLYLNSVELLNQVNALLEEVINLYGTSEIIDINVLLNNDYSINLLNSVYQSFYEICEIRDKLINGETI